MSKNVVTRNNDPDIAYIAAALRDLDKMAKVFSELLPAILKFTVEHTADQERVEAIPDQLDEIKRRLEIIEKATLSHQEKLRVETVTNALWDEMKNGIIDSIKRRIKKQVDNLNCLQEEEANFAGSPPVELKNRISAVKDEIEKLKIELESYQRKEI